MYIQRYKFSNAEMTQLWGVFSEVSATYVARLYTHTRDVIIHVLSYVTHSRF